MLNSERNFESQRILDTTESSLTRPERISEIIKLTTILLAPFSALWAVVLFSIGNPLLAAGDAVICACLCLVYWMVRSAQPILARHVLLVSGIAFILYTTVIASGNGQIHNGPIHYWLLVVILSAFFLLVDIHPVWRYLYVSFCACAFIVIEYAVIDIVPIEPIPRVLWEFGHPANLTMVVIALIAMTRLFVVDISKAEQTLDHVNHRLNQLLSNVLPTSVAHRLEKSGQTFADSYGNATVLFADIVGFTKLSESMEPNELVRMLNSLFIKFDRLTENCGAEKIKTIGDAYMVASGVPFQREDHGCVMANLALEMKTQVSKYENINIRIGIHSGPIVAGVIGRKRLIYDLWGDTVNTASRMESHGIPGEIQISESTKRLLGKKYKYESRGSIEVKGKGQLNVFLLKNKAN